MKKDLILFLALVLSLSLVQSLEFSGTTDTNVIVEELRTPIKLTLDITNAEPGKYNVYTLADLYITPDAAFQISNNSIKKEFLITPTENLRVDGYYTFTYTLNHRDVEKIDRTLSVKVLNLEEAVEISSESINYDSKKISFYVQNKENVKLEDLDVRFESIFFKAEEKFDLNPFEKHVITVSVNDESLKKTSAGVYVIKSIFDTPSGNVVVNGNLYLGEKKGISVSEDSSGFFVVTKTIDKMNTGNIFESVETRIEKNIFSRLFTSFNLEPSLIERDGSKVTYIFKEDKLAPAETFTVQARTNYILPFFLIVVLVLAILGVRKYTESKVSLTKSVKHVRTKGGEFALKVTLHIRASKSVENVSVIDRIPSTVKLYKQFEGAKPDKIDPETRRISWGIGNLNAGEERILSYVVYSKVGFVGKFVLPEGLIVFEKEGKIHEADSNKVFFMSEQIKGE